MIDSSDNQRRLVLSVVTNARAEEWEDPLREQAPGEAVDVRVGLHIEEWHDALLVIRKDSHRLRLLLERKTDWGGVQSSIFIAVPQTHRPVAILWLGSDHTLPVDRPVDHAQIPEGLLPHWNLINNQTEELVRLKNRILDFLGCYNKGIHLKVEPPRDVALLGQNTDDGVEALRVVWNNVQKFATARLLPVSCQDDVWMGGVRV